MCAWVRSTLAGLDGFFEVRCGTRNLGYAIPEGPASAQALALETEHKCGVTDTLDCFWRPTAIGGGTKSAVRASHSCALSGPPANAPGPRRDSQWPGRRNLARRGTSSRAPGW